MIFLDCNLSLFVEHSGVSLRRPAGQMFGAKGHLHTTFVGTVVSSSSASQTGLSVFFRKLANVRYYRLITVGGFEDAPLVVVLQAVNPQVQDFQFYIQAKIHKADSTNQIWSEL